MCFQYSLDILPSRAIVAAMIVTAAKEKSIVGEGVQLGDTVQLSTMFIMGLLIY